MVVYLTDNHPLSERRACILVGQNRSSCRYQATVKDDDEIRLRLRGLAEQRRRFGAPRLHTMLRREGYLINLSEQNVLTVKKVSLFV